MASLLRLFLLIYEDKLKGSLADARFAKMSGDFENEQKANKSKLYLLSGQIKSRADKIDTAKIFLEIDEKTTHLEVLTADIVREFIDRIVIHHRKRIDGIDVQKIEIYYNVIGKIEVPLDYIEKQAVSLTTRKGIQLQLEAQ